MRIKVVIAKLASGGIDAPRPALDDAIPEERHT
jgi:hypothetical protein